MVAEQKKRVRGQKKADIQPIYTWLLRVDYSKVIVVTDLSCGEISSANFRHITNGVVDGACPEVYVEAALFKGNSKQAITEDMKVNGFRHGTLHELDKFRDVEIQHKACSYHVYALGSVFDGLGHERFPVRDTLGELITNELKDSFEGDYFEGDYFLGVKIQKIQRFPRR